MSNDIDLKKQNIKKLSDNIVHNIQTLCSEHNEMSDKNLDVTIKTLRSNITNLITMIRLHKLN